MNFAVVKKLVSSFNSSIGSCFPFIFKLNSFNNFLENLTLVQASSIIVANISKFRLHALSRKERKICANNLPLNLHRCTVKNDYNYFSS